MDRATMKRLNRVGNARIEAAGTRMMKYTVDFTFADGSDVRSYSAEYIQFSFTEFAYACKSITEAIVEDHPYLVREDVYWAVVGARQSARWMPCEDDI